MNFVCGFSLHTSNIIIIYGLYKADVYSRALNYPLESRGVWTSWCSV